MRTIIILSMLMFSCLSAAQSNFGWECTRYKPQSEEIAEIVSKAEPRMPAEAVFQRSCLRETLVQSSATEFTQSRSMEYQFFWPSEKKVGDLHLMQEGTCSRRDSGAVSCETMPWDLLEHSPGEVIRLNDIESASDLEGLLEFHDRFFGESNKIRSIRQKRNPEGRNEQLYEVVDSSMGPVTRYDVRQRCHLEPRCTWEVLNVGYIIY
jgi:hypothetical protein